MRHEWVAGRQTATAAYSQMRPDDADELVKMLGGRGVVEQLISYGIELLDALDGDPDAEPSEDENDTGGGEDEFVPMRLRPNRPADL